MGFRPQLISCTAGPRFNRIEKGPKMGPKGILEKYRRMYRSNVYTDFSKKGLQNAPGKRARKRHWFVTILKGKINLSLFRGIARACVTDLLPSPRTRPRPNPCFQQLTFGASNVISTHGHWMHRRSTVESKDLAGFYPGLTHRHVLSMSAP